MTAQPIETRYQGYRMRSRLEARYGVFFDALGIGWQYEPEGYQLGSVSYLPDFWLPQVNLFGEVKPTNFSDAEFDKCERLVNATGRGCVLLVGMPESKAYEVIHKENGDTYTTDIALTNYKSYPVRGGRFYYEPTPHELEDFRDTIDAANAARSARFEFGERGAA